MKTLNYLLFFVSLIVASCTTVTDPIQETEMCDQQMVLQIDNSILSNSATISNVELIYNEGCLEIEVGFSGCDPDHEMVFITDGSIMESFPVQVTFAIKDQNLQDCEAYWNKTYSVGIDEIGIFDDYDKFYLNLAGTDKQFLIEK